MKPIATPFALDRFVPYRLSVLSNRISQDIARLYADRFELGITEWRVLAVLGRYPGLSASQLAERTAMDKVAVSRAVAGLVALGHVERQTAAEDARRSALRLTTAGLDVYRHIVPMALAYERELSEAVSTEDLDRLNALLDRFAAVVSPDRALW